LMPSKSRDVFLRKVLFSLYFYTTMGQKRGKRGKEERIVQRQG
jgi:hypothetical protein